jgi:serine/threonine protein kinase
MIGGQILHYTILDRLDPGEPGVAVDGESYLADDTRLHRRVVLRFIPAGQGSDGEARNRRLREARTAARLSHPNIAAILAIEKTGEHAFVVTEHVEGESLRDLLRQGRLGLDRSFEIAVQILGALAGAHETGIVHRGLSPVAIVVTRGSRVKVLGFGPAAAWGCFFTELGYRSPEHVRGERIDNRGNLFSFGTVLYEMLTGCAPFQGDDESSVAHAIATATPQPLSTREPAVPPGLQAIVDRCLEKEREARYQSAVEIEADLARVRPRGGGALDS